MTYLLSPGKWIACSFLLISYYPSFGCQQEDSLDIGTQLQLLQQEIAELKLQLQGESDQTKERFMNTYLFLDAATGSANSLQSLICKESYRNKIASLNNPASNELGFNLEIEIKNALKPIMDKAKKTDGNKFMQIVGSMIHAGEQKSAVIFPTGNIFSNILGLVGNLAVKEKSVLKSDVDSFVRHIGIYFAQYERLHYANRNFTEEVKKLKVRLTVLQEDINIQLQDIVLVIDTTQTRELVQESGTEELLLKYFKCGASQSGINYTAIEFPEDAIKSCKDIAYAIQRIYDEYAAVYENNFEEIKQIIADTRPLSGTINQTQLNETIREIESLYNESKGMDADNLRLKTLFDRLESVK